MAERLEEIGVRAHLQERRYAGMRELPNDRTDFARKQGAPAGYTEKTGGIPFPELPIEQAGFRRGRGTRDHIANLRWMMEKAREHQRDLYMCFIDYKKAFDCVDHEILWVVLSDMGVPVHLIVLLRRLYTNQEATVRTEFGETDNIDIGKGVRHCRDVSSHHCYSTYTQKT